MLIALLSTTLTALSAGPSSKGKDYVAHEWGTFTSVQGAEGIQMDWNPFVQWDLPTFVHDQNQNVQAKVNQQLAGLLLKSKAMSKQRMETPVIYFYSDQELTVDVKVRFPQGLMTEWYPAATAFAPDPTATSEQRAANKESFLAWNQMRILAPDADQALQPPSDQSDNHYYAARETSANLLEVAGPANAPHPQHEKFLFYRGVGDFTAPLTASIQGDEQSVRMDNRAKDALTGLAVLRIRGETAQLLTTDHLEAGQNATLKLDSPILPKQDLRPLVRDYLKHHLVAAGLYPREAEAMVKTWDDSWFGEEGLRVLYLLPQSWTDEALPITLDPQPKSLVRVMVGRAELITPSTEWELLKQAVRFSDADAAGQLEAVTAVQDLHLGRFAEPTARRVLGSHPAPPFAQSVWNLLHASRAQLPVNLSDVTLQ